MVSITIGPSERERVLLSGSMIRTLHHYARPVPLTPLSFTPFLLPESVIFFLLTVNTFSNPVAGTEIVPTIRDLSVTMPTRENPGICRLKEKVTPTKRFDGMFCGELFQQVRARRPLVHHITNTVTINDCANITLCAGAAPVMAHAPEEVAEMVSLSHALVLNIGTLSRAQVDAMVLAGKRASELGIPIVLDPVGAGATRFRTDSVLSLLDSLSIDILKGNAGEIGVLAGSGGTVRGVDSAGVEGDPVAVAGLCARKFGCVVVMTGETDIIADGGRRFLVRNGTPLMGTVSGTGCMAASVIAAFAAVSEDMAVAAASGLAAFGLAGERAAEHCRGPSSFRTGLFDELARLTPAGLAADASVESADEI